MPVVDSGWKGVWDPANYNVDSSSEGTHTKKKKKNPLGSLCASRRGPLFLSKASAPPLREDAAETCAPPAPGTPRDPRPPTDRVTATPPGRRGDKTQPRATDRTPRGLDWEAQNLSVGQESASPWAYLP